MVQSLAGYSRAEMPRAAPPACDHRLTSSISIRKRRWPFWRCVQLFPLLRRTALRERKISAHREDVRSVDQAQPPVGQSWPGIPG
jgi:hypothetical protein